MTEVQCVQDRFCPCFSHLGAAFALCPMRERRNREKKHPAALYKIPTLHSIQPGRQLLLAAPPPKIKTIKARDCLIVVCDGSTQRFCCAFFACFISEHPSPAIKEIPCVPFTDAYK